MTQAVAFLKRPEHLSVVAVAATTLLAIAFGWQLRGVVTEATREVEVGWLRCNVPADWLVQEGIGDLVLVARSPARELPRYTVSKLRTAGPLPELAELRIAERQRSLSSFEVVGVESVVEGERRVHRVRYTYVDASDEGLMTVVDGVDEYFVLLDDALPGDLIAEDAFPEDAATDDAPADDLVGGAVLVASLETDAGRLDEAIGSFRRFVDSIVPVAEGESE